MEVDTDHSAKAKGEVIKEKPVVVVILVGAPGSGKSTFCEEIMRSSTRPWARICQDTIGNGKTGTKAQCLKGAASALKEGKSIFIDRCNLNIEQRLEFVNLRGPNVVVHAVVLDLPAKLCISRSVNRTEHEGSLQGGKAAAVVNRMLQKKELPKLSEGFTRITLCQNESDVQACLNTYSALGPMDTLPNGYFGQKNPDAKIQLGIMKFLKKAEVRANDSIPDANSIQSSFSQVVQEKNPGYKRAENVPTFPVNAAKELKECENLAVHSADGHILSDAPTLAFPSISTSDFQFDLEKASDIIIEKVEEFMNKLGNVRLVLVDLSHRSKILSLVKGKAIEKNIDSSKFFTIVGDITQLYSERGLHCNVIANAANWRLKPGGGGVNASIFNVAGPALEVATKEQAKSLHPGKSVAVPLPSTSPLFSREGVTHVIHVLGPNMNPQRPNCLNNDYITGCKVLSDAYTSLFEDFASIVRTQAKLAKGKNANLVTNPSRLQHQNEGVNTEHSPKNDQKIKREDDNDYDKSKKRKGYLYKVEASIHDSRTEKEHTNNDKIDASTTKVWGSWAQALYHIAMHPEKHKDVVLEILDDVVILHDLYPKARRHLLVLTRYEGLDCLAAVCKEHLNLLTIMHDVGMRWAEKFLQEDASLVFRLGYHSAPSMRQLHLHVISQDYDSKHLKNKKHWNSFNTAFFYDSLDVIEEVSNHGKATLRDDESLLSTELRCHRCRSAHPNIPRLKSHISNCSAPFPRSLLQNGRLVLPPYNAALDP